MARENITAASQDLMSDAGSILLSFVLGEQKEFPVILDMVAVANADYEYEAVLVEGLNDGAGTIPSEVQSFGVKDTLTVRLCEYKSDWDKTTAYDAEDVVDYGDLSYRLVAGTARVSALTPEEDTEYWTLHDRRTIYVQFNSTLASTYVEPPKIDINTYGFFELRVTETVNPIFNSTWKPARGLVEFKFSPTDIVADI